MVRAVFEILGSPKEHVEKTIQLVLDKLKTLDEVEIVKSETVEAKEVEGKLWSTFSEVEMNVKGLDMLMHICFNFMPSSVEIIEPGKMVTEAGRLSDFFNDLLGKLHRYDMLVKNLNAQNLLLSQKLKEK